MKKNYILISSLLVVIISIVAAIALLINGDSGKITVDEEEKKVPVSSDVKEPEPENENKALEKQKDSGELEVKDAVSENQKNDEFLENSGYIEGQELPSKPTYIKGVLIANKKYPLPKDFAPGESKEARAAFEKMAQDAKKQGFELVAFSTYRSYEYQEMLYNQYVERDGKDNADRYSARAGYSEHQTGLAFDIGEKGREDLWLTEEFGESPAGKWLAENAHKYGFILRYPKGKEHITGYMYESWHFRYLGVELATKVKESGLTLEEYLGIDG